MPLSKKNYYRIAHILASNDSKGRIINSMADYLKEDNPRFDRDRFVNELTKKYVERKHELHKVGKKVRIGGFRFEI